MPANALAYVQMAEDTTKRITGSYQDWTAFLQTAARLYKYPYHEQLMIFAQRPDATACAEYGLWNKTMRRYVRRGSKGIALIDPSRDTPRIRYVFDVSDTGTRQNSLTPFLWELGEQHVEAVHTALENRYGISNPALVDQLQTIAGTLARGYWEENKKDILDIVDGSYLEGYDEFNVGASFRNAAAVSISYALMSRCGMEPDAAFTHENFMSVFDWNTPATVTALGTAVSQISEQVLRQIEITVKNVERSMQNERDSLPSERGLSDSEPDLGGNKTPDEVREDAEEIPAGEPSGPVQQPPAERSAAEPSPGDGRDGEPETGGDDPGNGAGERSDGRSEGDGSDEMGGSDEHPESTGGRDDPGGTDLRLTDEPEATPGQPTQAGPEEHVEQLSLFPSAEEQIKTVDAIRVHRPIRTERSDRPVLALSDEEIDHVLRRGSGFEGGKLRIAALYALNPTPVDARVFLSNEYGVGGHSHTFLDGTSGFIDYNSRGMQFRRWKTNEEMNLRWHVVERHIRGMMEQGTYLTPQEQRRFDEMQRDFAGEEMPLPQPRMHYPPEIPTEPRGYVSTNRIITRMDIERTLREWNGDIQSKHAMERYIREGHTTEEIAERLRELYGGDLPSLPVMVNDEQREVPWTDAANALDRLAWDNEFYTEEEQERLDDIDPVAIRENLEREGIENGQIVEPEAETPAQEPLRPGERLIPEHDGIPAMREVTIDLTPRQRETPQFSWNLHPGDTVYMDGREFIVEENRPFEVSFSDPAFPYPILRAEGKESLEWVLARDERNSKYRINPESPATERTEDSQSEQPEVTIETEIIPEVAAQNFRITDDHLGEGGQKTKYANNVAAIRTLKTIEAENRQATPEEQEILSRYVGWGGIPQVFDERNPAWDAEYTELKGLLTEEEYEMARASTLNAHYTSPTAIRAIYDAVEQMGFRTGNILEPSCGVGNFFGLLPESMADSRLYGVELDSITGRIAQYLYPQADIMVTGFEKTDRRDFFDLAIGNVPFGSYKLSDKRFDKHNFLIHDYFFAKALDQVRPGGIVAFITSKGTMDKQSPEVRQYIAQRAELLGAIRLPNNAFKANAGTEVTSDVIFLQKREQPIDIEPDWVHLGLTEDGIPVNSYFVDHPEMVLGTMAWDDSMYGNRQETACLPIEGADLSEQLAAAVRSITGEYHAVEMPDLADGEEIRESIPADPDVKNFSYTVVDDKVYYRENSVMVRPELNATAQERVKGMVALRDCVHRLMDAQLNDDSEETIHAQQRELNQRYDDYTAKYGLINSRANAFAFSDDSAYYLLCSLEILNENGELERKADMFTKRTIRQQKVIEHVDTAVEALAVSIAEKARVDVPYMAELTGKDEEEIADELTGVIFQVPGPLDEDGRAQYVTADEYLSGNVRQKLREAEDAAEMSEYFDVNVQALKAAQPKDLDASEIDVRLGATWVGKQYIQQFMEETLEIPFYQRRAIQVQFSEYTAEWHINGKNVPSYSNVPVNITYGTDRANGLRILEDTLNLRDIRIYDTVQDADGKERRVLNQKETTLAQQKQQALKNAFQEWIWKDPERRETLVKRYNEKFNAIRTREYDGSHITFSGMNPEIVLREHQRNAIAHILYGGNTLLAHQVGAGKTFEMTGAAMESKRLGLCQKSMFVVPNHLTEQWAAEFLRLYPSAKILVTTKKDFEKANRKKFCARIATGDYDAVIIGHSQFERIPVSQERQERLLKEQIDELTSGIQELKMSRGEQFSIKQLERTKRQLESRLRKLQATEKKDDVVTFEQLGVDRLFVDEAHSHKNLFLTTKMRNVAGLSTSEAQKSTDMFLKCRYMDEITGGRGVIFATGTPVTNSMTELYTMQRYLQYGTLKRNNMTHFDCWASTFGETVTAIELAPEGTGYRARTRFAKFFNLPELMTMFKEIADIKTADQLHLPTPEAHYETVVAQPTEHQQAMIAELSERASRIHGGTVDPRVDNMLKITSDGRKLGLDQRLINPLLPDDPGSKVNACVNNVFRIWQEGTPEKLTQLIFCDISMPKGKAGKEQAKEKAETESKETSQSTETTQEDDFGDLPPEETEQAGSLFGAEKSNDFSVYEDIRDKLIARGITPEEIAFIHDADTEVKKKELFAKVRSGQVRVLMGSTAKMGAGTNVQDRLIASHDLDCPWRPGDLEQRAGRIVRQGNMNLDVHIYRYVTEGSFDSYLWQTVENKQKFISQIMTSKSPVRSCEDVDETALSYAEIKALCAGDDRIKEKMALDVDVARLKLMKAEHQSNQYRLEDQLLKQFPREIEQNRGYLVGLQKDLDTLAEHPLPEKDFIGMRVQNTNYTERDKAGEAILEACKTITDDKDHPIGEYRGLQMSLSYNAFAGQYILTMKSEMSHSVDIGTSALGNMTRIDNALNNIPVRMRNIEGKLESLNQQMATARAELGKPFPQEVEFKQKSERLAELDAALNMDNAKGPQEQEKPTKPKQREEAR